MSSAQFHKKVRFINLFVVAVCSLFVGIWVFRESPSELLKSQIPLGGDGASTGFYLRLLIESNWGDAFTQHIYSDQFGWPGTLDYTNYPSGNLLELVVIKLFSSLTGINDPSSLIHIFAVLKIIPITLASYLLFRKLGSQQLISLVGALAFATSSFNLIRAEGHFFLGFTWAVPVSVALLYIAFDISYREFNNIESKSLSRKQIRDFVLPSILVGLSSFYFALISLILTVCFVFFIFFGQLGYALKVPTNVESFKNAVFNLVFRVRAFLLIVAGISLGLLIQIFPILLRSRNLVALSGIADRSWTESIVFSGSVESFFFDFTVLCLKFIGRPEIASFASTRISWEGSQVGALAGFTAIVCLLLLSIQASRMIYFKKIDLTQSWLSSLFRNMQLRFFFLVTFISFLLYLPSPINFGISQFLPQIRAWGRVSVFLTLCMISILLVMIQSLKKYSISAGVLIATMIAIPYFEATSFRNSRPASTDISRVAVEDIELRKLTLSNMKGILKEKCSIFQIPIYPYPEFDIPSDSVGDYAGIAIAAQDYGYFKWSSPAIKDTDDWKALQPLVSQSPNFARVGVKYSIEYGNALGACAALIDRAQLTRSEKTELNDLITDTRCFSNLVGEKFEKSSRYVIYKYGNDCPINLRGETIDFAKSNTSGSYLWKIDQAYGLGFVDGVQMFPAESVINIRFISDPGKTGPSNLNMKYFFDFSNNGRKYEKKVKICKRSITSGLTSCIESQIRKDGAIEIKLNSTEITLGLNKLELSLEDFKDDEQAIRKWGVVLRQN